MNRVKTVRITLMLSLLFAVGFQANAQRLGSQTVAMLQQSPAGSKIISFVNAVNEGKPVTDDFIKEIMSDALIEKAGLDQLKNIVGKDIAENDGKLTVYKIDRVERLKFELYAKGDKSNEWIKMDFTFEGQSPFKITGVGVDTTEQPDGVDQPMKIG